MPDSQPRSLGQDEKDHIIKISSLSTKPAERQELLCWAVGQIPKNSRGRNAFRLDGKGIQRVVAGGCSSLYGHY